MRLLDLFCCQGGAAMGYHRAGFEVLGVDIEPQPRYPFEFHQGDALVYLAAHGHEFDAIHASPPCQKFSATASMHKHIVRVDLIAPTRELLVANRKPWIIENVVRAPLRNPTILCGSMFGLETYRHRLFETSFPIPFFLHQPHGLKSDTLRGKDSRRPMTIVAGHPSYAGGAERWKRAMGIDWMSTEGITQAIPPAYTEFIGRHLLQALAVTP